MAREYVLPARFTEVEPGLFETTIDADTNYSNPEIITAVRFCEYQILAVCGVTGSEVEYVSFTKENGKYYLRVRKLGGTE